jgi:hypothetical protein
MDVTKGSNGASSSSSNSASSGTTSGSLEPVLSVETKLEQLQALGFTKNESELALTQAEGDMNLAATLLFSSR